MARPRPPLLEGSRLAFACALLSALALAAAVGLGHLTALPATAIYLAVASAMTYLLFAWDKRRARAGGRRISEANLLWLACLGGGTGGWLAMGRLRHKTRKLSFRLLIPTACLLQLAGLAYLAYETLRT